MKRYLFIFTILFLSSICFSQSITWQKVYKGSYISDYFGNDVCFADNGNFFIIGNNNYPRGIYVIKINSYGDTLWTKFIENGEGYTSVSSGDGGCVITGLWQSSPTITYTLKLNSNSNIVWQKLYNNSQTAICYDIIMTTDNKFIACGKVGYDDGYILKIDSSGNMIWQKSYPSTDNKAYLTLLETNDGCYIAGGYITDTPYETAKGVLTKIDTSGNIIWEKRYNTYQHSISNIISINKINQYYIISGNAFDSTSSKWGICFKKLNMQGDVIFSKFYTPTGDKNYYASDSKIINSNKYLFSYNRYGSSPTDSILANAMVTDSLGNIIIHREFIGTDYTVFTHTMLIDNKDILFVGNSNHISPYYENIYVVRTDSNLYAPPVGINNISTIVPDDYILYQNYPNPFNSSTVISYILNSTSNVVLTIYDINCKKLKTLINNKQKSGIYKILFDATGLPSGIYFYQLKTSYYQETKKMIYIK